MKYAGPIILVLIIIGWYVYCYFSKKRNKPDPNEDIHHI